MRLYTQETLDQTSSRWNRVIIIETDEFHTRYSFEASRQAREEFSRRVIMADDGANGGKGNRNKKLSDGGNEEELGPSISAPLITFSHLGI